MLIAGKEGAKKRVQKFENIIKIMNDKKQHYAALMTQEMENLSRKALLKWINAFIRLATAWSIVLALCMTKS